MKDKKIVFEPGRPSFIGLVDGGQLPGHDLLPLCLDLGDKKHVL